MKRAVALLSGGLDSTTATAIAARDGYSVYAISFDYQQRHRRELESAKRVGEALGVLDHKIVRFDLRSWGGSALTGDIEVPKDRAETEMAAGIPITYVPARNTIFLAFALAYAEVVGADTLVAGMSQIDYSGYPDCRGEFLDAFGVLANLATKAGVEGTTRFRVWAPLLNMTKSETIRRGLELGIEYGLTWSCYEGAEFACGRCDSCLLRLKGFSEVGTVDPVPYLQMVA
jgi:7-cyano-7-deazaguanine synthase